MATIKFLLKIVRLGQHFFELNRHVQNTSLECAKTVQIGASILKLPAFRLDILSENWVVEFIAKWRHFVL